MMLVSCIFHEPVYFGVEKFKPISHLLTYMHTKMAITGGRKYELAKTILTVV